MLQAVATEEYGAIKLTFPRLTDAEAELLIKTLLRRRAGVEDGVFQ